jgi:serine protease Do
VRLNNGEEYEAEVVGTDPDTDLAVLRVNAGKELPAATLGDSDKLKVGQFAIAIGSPRQLEGSVSFGHISALNRDGLPGLTSAGLRFQHLIQTDAAINLGNSGGPLCNIDGEVIGINVAIIWGANSIGFAIPINVAREIVPRLIQDGRITRGFLGVGIDDAARYADAVGSPDKKGAFVKEVRPGTPAERAEIQTYDLIRKINGKEVENASDLVHQISSYPPGTTVTIELWRDGAPLSVEVELTEWKGQKTAKAVEREPVILGMRVNNATPEILERLGLDPATTGVIVTEIQPNGPAEAAGLMQGDVILEVAQQPVGNAREFADRIEEKAEPGKSLLIRYSRQGGEPDITVVRVPAK